MNYTEKYIVETYSGLFEGLSPSSKIGLIEKLSKSLQKENKKKSEDFYKSFGAFVSAKPVEEIVKEIRSGRTFKRKEIKF